MLKTMLVSLLLFVGAAQAGEPLSGNIHCEFTNQYGNQEQYHTEIQVMNGDGILCW